MPVAALGLSAGFVGFAQTASAHGSTIDPPSRNYGCNLRWEANWQSPEMAAQDPMCDQAWKAEPNAMWNWNGLYRENVGGNHEAAVPDGSLCSGGHTASGRYDALDVPGKWIAKTVGTTFPLTVRDEAMHGADYYRVYVTKQGFDPTTQKPGWADLDLVKVTRKYAPGEGTAASDDPKLTGVSVTFDVTVPSTRSGRAIVFTIWQASHLDQPYYLCSDVIFNSDAGSGSGGTPTASAPATAIPTWTTSPSPITDPATTPTDIPTTSIDVTTTPSAPQTGISSTTVPATSTAPAPPGGGVTPAAPPSQGCTATYQVINKWPGGHLAEVTVVNGPDPASGWKVSWNYSGSQLVNQLWNGIVSTDDMLQSVSNAPYNGTLAPNASTTFGLLGAGEAPVADLLGCVTS